jgi:SAM-dependent methyltransferase
MHPTAMRNCQSFFDAYTASFSAKQHVKVIEIGSQNVNGTLRDTCPTSFEYIGVDFQQAKGVDIVLNDPYVLPFEDNSVDIVLSSSCFEHSEMFWLVFLEIMRVLKPDGIFYLNAPSAGSFHRYPVDCWRFYPDSGKALVQWAKVNEIPAAMLESYTQTVDGWEDAEGWQDYVCVFLKNETYVAQFPHRILDSKKDFENGQLFGDSSLLNLAETSQNEISIKALNNKLADTLPLHEHQVALAKIQTLLEEAALVKNLQQQLCEELNILHNSTSWRITAPLRRLKRLLQ